MDIENIQIIPIEASDPKNLIRDLKKIFESEEAADAKSVVYFFLSKHPIPRLKSESKILYIGKTINTLKQRWLPNVEKLNSKKIERSTSTLSTLTADFRSVTSAAQIHEPTRGLHSKNTWKLI